MVGGVHHRVAEDIVEGLLADACWSRVVFGVMVGVGRIVLVRSGEGNRAALLLLG